MSGSWNEETDPSVDQKIAAHNASDAAHDEDLTARFAAHDADEGAHADLIAAVALTLQLRSEKGQAGGYAALDGAGKVPSSQIPAVALGTVNVVASQAAQVALAAQQGDVAVRSDENRSYVHNGGGAGTMDDWTLLLTPTDAVLSVNGEVGAVSLTAAEVGASPVGHGHVLGDVAGLEDAIESTSEFAVIDAAGHSLTKGGYIERVARARGANVLRNAGVGGGISYVPAATPSDVGSGGWGHVLGCQFIHEIMPKQGWPTYPNAFLPPRSAGVLHFNLNDFPKLGVGRPAPWLEAMRSMICHWLSVCAIQNNDATATRVGTWTNSTFAGYATGADAGWSWTATENDYIEWAVPSHYPGGVVGVSFVLDPTHDLTVGFRVNGVNQPSRRLVGADLCGTAVNGGAASLFNLITHRLAVPAGTGAVRVILEDSHVANSRMNVDSLNIEAADDIAPVIVVPGLCRPLTYGIWGNPAGMNDANVMSWDPLIQALVDEFGPSVRHADIDTALNKEAANFVGDGAHLSTRGDGRVGEVVLGELDAGWTRKRALATVPRGGGRVYIFGAVSQPAPLLGTWSNGGGGTLRSERWFSLQQDLDGMITLGGRITGGADGNVTDLPEWARPTQAIRTNGYHDGGGGQRWDINPTTGRVSIGFGYAAGGSNLKDVSWYPAA
jgi:hypothetical protein